MVAVITGARLGLQTSSRDVLGALGQWGSSALGRAQENVYVNAATGNLVIQKQDDFLVGLGSSSLISRTYNSLGDFSDDNGDNWRVNQKKVDGLTGTLNTVGSTVTRTDWDGSKTVYTWDASRSQYVCEDGAGAHEAIIYNAGWDVWHWTDGGGVRYEYYDHANSGRLSVEGLRGGSYNSYYYNSSGQLYRIWASGTAYTEFTYSGNNLTSLLTASSGTLTRTRYAYDGSNRLTSVTVDMTPADSSTADGKTYVTAYTYDGSSKRVASITQTDGTSLTIGYTLVGSDYRVTSLAQTGAAGGTRTTSLSYNTSTRVTTITDPLSQTTQLAYDAAGQLLSVTAASRTTSFTYDGDGNVLTVAEPSGEVTTYTYDSFGNRTLARDQAGNTTAWTYNGWSDQVLTETRYRTPDPDGAGGGAASDGVTTRNVYSPYNKLRFTVTAEGRVTEYRYDIYGQVTSVIDYGDSLYTTTGSYLYDTTMEAWVSGLSDKSNTTRTDTTYDWRGNVDTVTSYGKILTSGAGDTAATTQISKTYYIYDANGRLLSRQVEGNAATETFVYDGLGRLIGSTDMLGDTTTIAFNDAAGQTVITLDNGSTTTSVYNGAGELVSMSVAGSGVTTATSGYKYDSLGRLRVSIDPAGVRTYFFYNAAGFKEADIAADGSVVEYKYNADGQVIATVAYATRIASGTLSTLVDGSNNPTSVTYSSVRPSTNAADRWAWNIYDTAGRLVETIDGAGTATTFTYDGASQLVSTRTYATALSVSGYKTTPPTSLQLPSTYPSDRVTRNFYDDDGNLEGVLDASGSLSKIVYDGAGRKVETIAYATRPNSAYWAAGTLADLLTSAGTHAGDVRTRFVYDGRGLLRGTVNAEGGVTSLSYDAAGRVTKAVEHATLYTSSSVPDFGDLQSWISSYAGSSDRITRTIYDAKGQAVYVVDAEGFVTKNEYDFAGRVTKAVRYAVAVSATDGMTPAGMAALLPGSIPSTAAVTTYAYDSVGRLTDVTDAEGGVTHTVYDVLGQVTDVTVAYGTIYASTTHYTYDYVGQVLTETRAYGESYATTTRYTYDAFGQVTDMDEAYGTGDQATTHYVYNAAGRVTAETRAYGESYATTTSYTRDAFGQVIDMIEAYGTSDAATTRYVHDAMGRMTAETRGYGESYATTTAYAYTAFGQLRTVTTAYGAAYSGFTLYDYDRLGRRVTTMVLLEGSTYATTSSQYDAFGNLVKLTDPRGNAAYYYYDKLGRQTLQIDPEGYATQTTYAGLGEISKVRRYLGQTTGAAVGSAPSLTSQVTAGTYADTSFTRDRLGRVTATTDAMGFTESYTLNALGQRLTVTNKLGGVTTNTYDKLGRLTYEILPITSATNGQYIKNYYGYDRRGNRTVMIEAHLFAEQRGTNYAYDKLNRLIAEGDGDIITVGTNFQDLPILTPTEYLEYDRRGNIVRTTNATGYQTWHWYDDAGRKVAQVDATGTLSTWNYDLNGNVLSAKVWDTAVTSPSLGTIPTGSGTYRETTYTYDRNNRRLSTSVAGVKSAHYASGYTISTSAITTYTNYDANGNLVQEIDGEGNSAYHYYDKLGRKKATVDREGYVTTYALDAEGNVLTETRYATQTSGLTATVFGTPGTTTNDRVTTFTYDKNGRRLTEMRAGVAYRTVNTTTGALSGAATAGATITYTYNGLGQVLTRTEASSETTTYDYDAGGRLESVTGPSFVDSTGATVARMTEYSYDGLNNVTREFVHKSGGTSADDRITYYTYGRQGRLDTVTDANGFVRTYGYDREGNVVRVSYVRTKSNGTTVTEADVFKYDALNRQTFQAKAVWNGSAWSVGDSQEIQYNRHGEISAKGTNGLWQETFLYDKGGRLVRTTAGDGVTRFFFHDKNGNVTLTVASAGADLSAYATQDDLLPALGTIVSPVMGMLLTLSIYNRRDDNITDLAMHQYLPDAHPWSPTSRTFNAFGEVLTETTVRHDTTVTPDTVTYAVTNYTYNTLGKLIEKKNPEVSITAENGAITNNYRPTENYYYDLSGRLVGFDDANGNRTTRQVLAGSGYDGADTLVTAEHHADGGVKKTGYDVFGNAVKLTDEMTRVTTQTFDKMGRLLTVTKPSTLVDSYAYDELGQRTQHWNSLFTSSYKEKTDYDAQGRVIQTVDFESHVITYAYAWNGSLTTSGLATFGGWTKTTTQYGTTATESTDVFGRVIGRVNYAGATYGTYSFTYNKAGWLTAETGGAAVGSFGARNITYTYFNTGQVASITDTGGQASGSVSVTTYAYDEQGNKLREKQEVTIGGVTKTIQNATSTYDNMNRRLSITEAGQSITYEYDAVGNQRREQSTGHDAWYKYDSLNRMVTVDGQLVGSRGSGTIKGQQVEYDASGRRMRVSTTYQATEWAVNYVNEYTTPGEYVPAKEEYSFYLRTADIISEWVDYGNMDYYAEDKDHNIGISPGYGPSTGPGEGESFYWCASGYRYTPEINNPPQYYAPGTYTGWVNYDRVTRENYIYNADGYLTQVTTEYQHADGSWSATSTTASDTRDALGRSTGHFEYLPESTVLAYSRNVSYDKVSNVTSETIMNRGNTLVETETTTSYVYLTSGGVYYGGQAVSSSTTGRHRTWSGSSFGSWTTDPSSTMANAYILRDGALLSTVTFTTSTGAPFKIFGMYIVPGLSVYTSTYNYDANSNLSYVAVADGAPRMLTYLSNARGQRVWTKETAGTTAVTGLASAFAASVSKTGRFDGIAFKTDTEYHSSYLATMLDRNGAMADPEPLYDGGFEPVTPNSVPYASGSYTVRSGETLMDIAAQTWGDASLWYIIAEANGLSGSSSVAAGTRLTIPNKIVNVHNTSDTFRPYNPNDNIGDVSPTRLKPPPPPKRKHGCGGIGQILKMIVAVVVTVLLGPVGGNWVLGAFHAAVGNVASQAFGLATGIQDSFSWKELGMSVIGGGVGAANIPGLDKLGAIGNYAARNAITQGIGVATGLQDKMDWAGVAMSGIMGGVSSTLMNSTFMAGASRGARLGVSNMAGALAASGARSLIDGSSFGDNIKSLLPSVISNTVGGMLQREIGPPSTNKIASVKDFAAAIFGGACFVAGTLVHTRTGLRAIESIRAGDWVASRNEASNMGSLNWRKVIETYQHSDKLILHLTVLHSSGGRETLSATPEHPFFVNGGWTKAANLSAGDYLELKDGNQSQLLEVSPGQGLHTVYNFAVENDHTYFVGEEGIWAHNVYYFKPPEWASGEQSRGRFGFSDAAGNSYEIDIQAQSGYRIGYDEEGAWTINSKGQDVSEKKTWEEYQAEEYNADVMGQPLSGRSDYDMVEQYKMVFDAAKTDSFSTTISKLWTTLNYTVPDARQNLAEDAYVDPDLARIDQMRASPIGAIAWGGARLAGASPQTQDAFLNLGTAFDGLSLSAAGLRGGTPAFVGASRIVLEPTSMRTSGVSALQEQYYPPNNGSFGGSWKATLPTGTLVDRYGYDSGSYLAPVGTPAPMRALPPGTMAKPYTAYEVTQPLEVRASLIAPWFGEPGMGIQYQTGVPVRDALSGGYLREVPR